MLDSTGKERNPLEASIGPSLQLAVDDKNDEDEALSEFQLSVTLASGSDDKC